MHPDFSVVAFFPDYLARMLPLLNTIYLPSRINAFDLLRGPALSFAVPLAVIALSVAGRRLRPLPATLLVAAMGFATAALIQGKGYLNHGYPGTALAMLALAAVLSERGPTRIDRRIGAVAMGAVALTAWYAFANVRTYPGLEAAVARVAPAHPRLLVVGSELDLGHPLTRRLRGQWVGSRASLWAAGNAGAVLARGGVTVSERARLAAMVQEEIDAFLRDLSLGHPDVVLVDGQWGRALIASEPRIAHALRPFRPAGSAGEILILIRRAG